MSPTPASTSLSAILTQFLNPANNPHTFQMDPIGLFTSAIALTGKVDIWQPQFVFPNTKWQIQWITCLARAFKLTTFSLRPKCTSASAHPSPWKNSCPHVLKIPTLISIWTPFPKFPIPHRSNIATGLIVWYIYFLHIPFMIYYALLCLLCALSMSYQYNYAMCLTQSGLNRLNP